jgi:hypothetical protein
MILSFLLAYTTTIEAGVDVLAKVCWRCLTAIDS